MMEAYAGIESACMLPSSHARIECYYAIRVTRRQDLDWRRHKGTTRRDKRVAAVRRGACPIQRRQAARSLCPSRGIPMDRTQYREEYLKSDHWKSMRAAALERAEGRCQVCNSRKQLDVHHRTYERLGAERSADLTVLCRRCHELFHTGSKLTVVRPAKKAKTKRTARVCECGCGRPVKHRFAPGCYQRLQKDARNVKAQKARKQQVMDERRREVWDAIVNR